MEQTFLSCGLPFPLSPISRQEFLLSPCISLLFLKHLESGLEGTVSQVRNLPLGGSVKTADFLYVVTAWSIVLRRILRILAQERVL